MRKLSLSVVLAVGTLMLMASMALANGNENAAEQSPLTGDELHCHHVTAGGVDIDQVQFNAEGRGLHQGSNASSSATGSFDPTRGPWHGHLANPGDRTDPCP